MLYLQESFKKNFISKIKSDEKFLRANCKMNLILPEEEDKLLVNPEILWKINATKLMNVKQTSGFDIKVMNSMLLNMIILQMLNSPENNCSRYSLLLFMMILKLQRGKDFEGRIFVNTQT
jgi:hypothetical protein